MTSVDSSAPSPKLLDRVRAAIRTRHCSQRTEEAYVGWIRRFILFHRKRHPRDMGRAEVEAFLSALAVRRRVAASTQNQALAALLFLYREVLQDDLGWLDGIVRAKRPLRLPRSSGAGRGGGAAGAVARGSVAGGDAAVLGAASG